MNAAPAGRAGTAAVPPATRTCSLRLSGCPIHAVLHCNGLHSQVWNSPGLEKSVAPMELHRTFGQCHSDITSVDWSADSQWLVRAAAPAEQPPPLHGRAWVQFA